MRLSREVARIAAYRLRYGDTERPPSTPAYQPDSGRTLFEILKEFSAYGKREQKKLLSELKRYKK
jgi:hypothetical protein